MRRLVTFLVVAASSCAATLWWLYDGDWATVATDAERLGEEVGAWNADELAKRAGFDAPAEPPPE